VRASVPGLAAGAPLVVYAGALGRINAVDWLADLAAAVRPLRPDARFLVVGGGWGRERLLERGRALGVLDETLFVRDPVPKRDVPAILAAATVACSLFAPIPAMESNSANKFFDALAAGRPVLIDYGGWHRQLLEETGAGIAVPHADPAGAAGRLVALLGDPVVLAEAGTAARRLAVERFARDDLARRFAEVLEKAAAGSR
jgi:glycosyltransferase involved in cell wall biosynthesis